MTAAATAATATTAAVGGERTGGDQGVVEAADRECRDLPPDVSALTLSTGHFVGGGKAAHKGVETRVTVRTHKLVDGHGNLFLLDKYVWPTIRDSA